MSQATLQELETRLHAACESLERLAVRHGKALLTPKEAVAEGYFPSLDYVRRLGDRGPRRYRLPPARRRKPVSDSKDDARNGRTLVVFRRTELEAWIELHQELTSNDLPEVQRTGRGRR